MIDVHFHCLPRVDDEPGSWDEAVALCRAAAEDGTTTVVAPPHVLRHHWSNANPIVRDRLVASLNERLGGTPRVVPGCEYFYAEDVVALAKKGPTSPLTGLAGGSYLLVEFSPATVPASAVHAFHELRVLGVHPVVAHPERHPVFARQPERLADLVSRGALAQITARRRRKPARTFSGSVSSISWRRTPTRSRSGPRASSPPASASGKSGERMRSGGSSWTTRKRSSPPRPCRSREAERFGYSSRYV